MSILGKRITSLEQRISSPVEQVDDETKILLGIPIDYDFTVKQFQNLGQSAMDNPKSSPKNAIRY